MEKTQQYLSYTAIHQLYPTVVKFLWIGAHIKNPYHDHVHSLAKQATIPPANSISQPASNWSTSTSTIPHPLNQNIIQNLKPQGPIPLTTTDYYTANLVAKTYINHIAMHLHLSLHSTKDTSTIAPLPYQNHLLNGNLTTY